MKATGIAAWLDEYVTSRRADSSRFGAGENSPDRGLNVLVGRKNHQVFQPRTPLANSVPTSTSPFQLRSRG